jgi:hypothetical protein
VNLLDKLKCAWSDHEYWTGLDDKEMPKAECSRCGYRVRFDIVQDRKDREALADARKHIKSHGPERWYWPETSK